MACYDFHPNGFVPLSKATGTVPWNADHCNCGHLKDRRARQCRTCYAAPPIEKPCSGCNRTLPLSEFYKRSDRGFVSKCKKCTNERKASPELRRRYERNSRSRPGHYKRVAARIAKRRLDPRYRLAERLRATLRLALRKCGAKKAARTMELVGCSIEEFKAHIEAQWRSGMSWENWGSRLDCWQLDHIRPVASFDLTDPDQARACFHFTNFQPLWAPENAAKGARWKPEGAN